MSRESTEIDTDSPKGRLLTFCKMQGLSSNREIEKLFDLGNGYFCSAGRGMNTDTICKVARKYPSLNLNWLICGYGNIYAPDNISETDSSAFVSEAHASYAPSTPHTDTKVPVRMYDCIDSFTGHDPILPARWYMMEKSFLRHHDDALVRITDDSLYPHYQAEEYLQVSRSRTDALSAFRRDEKRLLLVTLKGSNAVARLVSRYGTTAGLYVLSALNGDKAAYPDIVCDQSQIVSLWEIVNVLHI